MDLPPPPPAAREQRIHPDEWGPALAMHEGPQIVVGGPGTGKSEFLVRRIAELLERSDVRTSSILVLSFGRRGVADLRSRVGAAVGSLGDLDVATFHSYAVRLIETYGSSRDWSENTRVLTGPEQLALVTELLASEDESAWSPAFRSLLTTRTFAQEVTDFVLRSAEQLLSAEDVAARGRDDWRGLPEFLARYRHELRRRDRIDYGTILEEAVHLVASDVVEDPPQYVLVDEYQDTTLAQAKLLELLASRHAGNITVAADPYQSVYSFRGTRLENVVEFPDRFRSPEGAPAIRIVLTTSFRAPAAILESAVNVTARNLPGAAGKVLPAPGDGRVETYVFGQLTEEAEWIAREVERLHTSQQIALADIGVLVRTKQRFLPELSRALERRGIAHDLPNARLADHPAVRFVLDLVAAAGGAGGHLETTRAMRRVLLGPVYRASLSALREIERAVGGGASWPEAVAGAGFDELAELLTDQGWWASMPAAAGAWQLWVQLEASRQIATDPSRVDERRAWRSLIQVLDRWNDRNPRGTLDDYRKMTEGDDFEAQPLLSYRQPDTDRVTVTTLHQAKGLEFDTVFIADAVEEVFPDLRSRDSLLGVRHLLEHLPTDNTDYLQFRLQEERRLAYTAMTRARRRVVWTATSAGAEIGHGIPSRFLPLVAGVDSINEIPGPGKPQGPPVSMREAEAELRRRVADPARGAGDRLAAAATLAVGDRWGMRPAAQHRGVAPKGDPSPLNTTPLRLSPSQADSYRTCPRRYAIERKLRQTEDSVYMRFGTLVHAVLEEAEAAARAQGRNRATYPEAARLLDQLMDPGEFGGDPFATAWRRRAQVGLAHLYSNWPGKGRLVDLERTVTLRIADVDWVGKVDRVDADEAGLRIVDYKTSKKALYLKEAETSLQLGFYALALAADPELGEYGPPVSAELWYPLADTKQVTTRKLKMSELGTIRESLIQLAASIVAENWEPTPGPHCDRCAYASSCPAVPEGGDQFA